MDQIVALAQKRMLGTGFYVFDLLALNHEMMTRGCFSAIRFSTGKKVAGQYFGEVRNLDSNNSEPARTAGRTQLRVFFGKVEEVMGDRNAENLRVKELGGPRGGKGSAKGWSSSWSGRSADWNQWSRAASGWEAKDEQRAELPVKKDHPLASWAASGCWERAQAEAHAAKMKAQDTVVKQIASGQAKVVEDSSSSSSSDSEDTGEE